MTRADLLERVNLPDLISSLAGGDAVRGLNRERGGVICDPRPGMSERHPSFSVYRNGAVWLWKRHGGDEESGTAFDLLLAFDYSPRASWDELARLAGLPVNDWAVKPIRQPAPRDQLAEARGVLERCKPFNASEVARLGSLVVPVREGVGAACELLARGLFGWPGLSAGELRRDFSTPDGRLLAHRGALAFTVRGRDGQPWALKIRNAGSADRLKDLNLCRYVYRIGGHGAPAWCSPDYGQGDAVLIVEGELNGAAASRALTEAGLKVDVQGLAGAGGTPFLHGLHGKPVFLYADSDPAGLACLERVGQVARCAGAREVKVLFTESEDFCDLLGRLGVSTFAGILAHRIEAAEPWQQWQKGITGKNALRVNNAVQHTENDYWQTGNTYQGWGNSEPSGWGAADRGGW